MMTDMEFNEVLFKRRSIRSFTDKPVTSEQIERLLTAAINAPSACNMQSWHFYAVVDPEVRAKFDTFCAPWVSTAPVIFVVCTDGEEIISKRGERARTYIIQDTALATENLLLAAADMGLNGCFIGAFDPDKCRTLMNIPAKYEIVALIPVGEPQLETPRRERKPLSEVAEIIGDVIEQHEQVKKPFELKGASLPNAVFKDLNLADSIFDNINMAKVSFNNINMSNIKFTDINLTGASFGGLCMNKTTFGCVDMNNAVFENPDLSGTTFRNCNFSGVSIADCKLDGMTVDDVNVSDALEYYKKNK